MIVSAVVALALVDLIKEEPTLCKIVGLLKKWDYPSKLTLVLCLTLHALSAQGDGSFFQIKQVVLLGLKIAESYSAKRTSLVIASLCKLSGEHEDCEWKREDEVASWLLKIEMLRVLESVTHREKKQIL